MVNFVFTSVNISHRQIQMLLVVTHLLLAQASIAVDTSINEVPTLFIGVTPHAITSRRHQYEILTQHGVLLFKIFCTYFRPAYVQRTV